MPADHSGLIALVVAKDEFGTNLPRGYYETGKLVVVDQFSMRYYDRPVGAEAYVAPATLGAQVLRSRHRHFDGTCNRGTSCKFNFGGVTVRELRAKDEWSLASRLDAPLEHLGEHVIPVNPGERSDLALS
ncbi:hypothetical protein SAMN04487925_106149 [Bradyrhizobium sp. cf659]|nr:hypothetical protein SAMN04487925_106149 [Bradyrhizobium sp. cf659]